jgi:hypothetical protein
MSAVQARVHYAMKQEFKLLKAIIRDHAPKDYNYDPATGNRKAKQADYDMVEVIPVSDPNSSTMAQRIMQYQAVIQLSQSAPQIYDLPQLHRQMIEVLGVKNAEKLVPTEDDEKPKDPITENMGFLKGEPTKAFMYQDHDAHIACHMTFMQDPMIAQQVGQSPMAQQMMSAIQAHIAEHLGFSYRRKIEEQLGVPLPSPEEQLPQQVEVQLSRLVATASTQLMQTNLAAAQQAQNQQMAQDPIVQMQQQELQLKAKEIEIKGQKVQGDLQVKQAELQLKAQEAANRQGEDPRVAAARAQQEIQAAQQAHEQQIAQSQQQHSQKMTQAERAHRQKIAHAERLAAIATAKAAQNPNKPKES